MSNPESLSNPADLMAAIHQAEGKLAGLGLVLAMLEQEKLKTEGDLAELHHALMQRLGNGVSNRRIRRRKRGSQEGGGES